jgi:hypothetical protein
MKKTVLVLLFLLPGMLWAQSAFEGTWRFTPQSGQFGGKPDKFWLQNGMYDCETCVPKIEVQADGKDHPRTGSPYSDAISVRAVDDRTIETISKKAGKVVGTAKETVSADGKTLTTEWSFVSQNGQQGNGKTISTRVAAAPAGAHKASGTWQPEKLESASESVMVLTYKLTDGGLSMSDLTGDSYSAKFDGKDYPYKGDPGTTSVSLKKIDANTIEETDKRDGKIISVYRMTVSSDGRTLKVESTDKLHGTTATFEAQKQ